MYKNNMSTGQKENMKKIEGYLTTIYLALAVALFAVAIVASRGSVAQITVGKAPCSSYINTNCEGYRVPMCERE